VGETPKIEPFLVVTKVDNSFISGTGASSCTSCEPGTLSVSV
jgi:hypothetical protein